ncbi:MAG: phage holin family protein [Muribaculaceae bacterium]|nr:phage holin family protein [Muribaculaceae bacterium]
MMKSDAKENTASGLARVLVQYAKLLLEDARLTMAEKLTRLLSALAFCSLLIIVGVVSLVFVSTAIALVLANAISPMWALIIVASFYVIVLVVLILCRKPLLVNPIARFVSRLVLTAPQNEQKNDESTPVS